MMATHSHSERHSYIYDKCPKYDDDDDDEDGDGDGDDDGDDDKRQAMMMIRGRRSLYYTKSF